MKKVFKNRNNSNFYLLKELQWTNKAMKMNQLNQKIRSQSNPQNMDSINYLKEKSWNKRFIYDSIQNYDASKDKNVLANFLGVDEMNCYHNAIKKNTLILKNIYSNKNIKKKFTEEFGKTNIRINLKPMGKTLQKTKIMNNSFSTNKFITNKRMTLDSFGNKNIFNSIINNNNNNSESNPDKLIKIWNDLCIHKPYRELFNIILSQLSEERKADICEKEFKELNELKNDLHFLSMSVYYRLKILEELNDLNDKLGVILKNKQAESNEVILKRISKKIENLREHTINICFSMQKIKSKINVVQSGKFDLDAMSEKFKFDKNYLIKMKEEMNIFREGFTKYFFEVGDDNDPFLLSSSKKDDTEYKIKDPFFHYIPMSDEIRENINKCIYFIYQELIGYKSSNITENNLRNISPLKKYNYKEIDIKIFEKHNEIFNIKNKKILNNNNLWRNDIISPNRTNYSEAYKPSKLILSDNRSENNKINGNTNYIRDIKSNNNRNYNKDIILNKKNSQMKYKNNKNINSGKYKTNNILNNFNKNKNKDIKANTGKIDSNFNKDKNKDEIYNEIHNNFMNDIIQDNPNNNITIKKEEVKSKDINDIDTNNKDNNPKEEKKKGHSHENGEENSKILDNNENLTNQLNNDIIPIQSKNIKCIIFNDDISVFSKDFYIYYFTLIPKEIKDMFKIEKNIIKNMTQGISPYLLMVYENVQMPKEIDFNNWANFKNYIIGICAFSFEYQNSSIKININHISNSFTNGNKKIDEKNLEEIKYIFKLLIDYIKNNFYFDEIILRYNSSKVNEQIINFILNDLNFVILNETENEEIEDDESKKENNKEKEKNEIYNKMVYTNDLTKNRVDDLIKEKVQRYIGKNILDILNCVVITNNTELITLEKGKKNEAYLMNNVIMKYLLEKKEKTNVNRIYSKMSNLDQLIKIFQNNNINKKEIPLSLAENRFDIISALINKTAFTNYFSNSIFFNNYNTNNPSSYFDKNSGYSYNYIKADQILILENEKHHIKLYHILSNNMSLVFCKVSKDFEKYLNKNNIYTQINSLYKETISLNKKEVLDSKILWIPCFEMYKHLKTLSSNGFGTFHEYIKISNKIIKQSNKEPLLIKSKNIMENDKYGIIPDLSNDILFDSDFIFGIVNNTEILNEKLTDENNGINTNNKRSEPYIIFLSLIKKSDFITN